MSNLGRPEMYDVPMVPRRMPSRPAIRPFNMAPRLSAETINTPKSPSAATSGKDI